MSVQFGLCYFDGGGVDPRDIEKVRPLLASYGPDREGYLCNGNFALLIRAFQTTKEERGELQPYISASGVVVSWDGRLDNREKLIDRMGSGLSPASTDLDIVATAYERWGTDSFAQLVGDWALSIWEPQTRSLVLAKDFAGTRHLYYSVNKDRIMWSTILDPLVLLAVQPLRLEEEYIAGWLGDRPAVQLTPYAGIHSVPASCFIRVEKGRETVVKYWDFEPGRRIRYRSDKEYEEQFRIILSESVRRRLRTDSPVLAELSGGIDSSSIVCVADGILSLGQAQAPRLDTVSYYDPTEPNWDELPYVATVEEQRGRIGSHIDVHSAAQILMPEYAAWACTPGSGCASTTAAAEFGALLRSSRCRILLSGLGGDEVLGGVPTPIPELRDSARNPAPPHSRSATSYMGHSRKKTSPPLARRECGRFPAHGDCKNVWIEARRSRGFSRLLQQGIGLRFTDIRQEYESSVRHPASRRTCTPLKRFGVNSPA